MNPRAIAAKILVAVIHQHHSLTTALNSGMASAQLTEPGLIKELCYGVLRWYFRLDGILKQLLNRPLKAKDADIHGLLLIGLYQLLYLRIPDHAAVAVTVEAARALKKSWATSLINGVLRQFLRKQQYLSTQLNEDPVTQYAHPPWLITMLKYAWPNDWSNILAANNEHPPLWLRVNSLRSTREEFVSTLQKYQMDAYLSAFAAQGIQLLSPCDVDKIPGFREGLCSVQDAAAQLAAELLELSPGQHVLDACAAPGGKAAHICERVENIHLTVLDIDSSRIVPLQETWQRLQLPAINCLIADAGNTDSWWDGQTFDRILLDAPCSATGVIRRHPDIKLLRKKSDIESLAQQQAQLLSALWPLLRTGGMLVYATCSVLPQENEQVLQHFLSEHANAVEKEIVENWGVKVAIGRQILPGSDRMDGFYYACLVKM